MTAAKKKAPSIAAATAAEGEDQNTNTHEGEPAMPIISDTAFAVERYVVVGTDVHDTHEGRIARFQHAEVARLGAEWLNGPDATPEDYEWGTPASVAHAIEDGVETYSFPSVLNHRQRHEMAREAGGPWTICPVDVEDSLTVGQMLAFTAELNAIVEFATRLEQEVSK